MKNYIRSLWKGFVPGLTLILILGTSQSNGAVLTLDFADGNGTTSVDQYTGIAGSGWKGGWTTATTGAAVTSSINTVTNTTPLYTGGNNYLQTSYTISVGGQWERVSRQIDSTAISLTSPITYSFIYRANAAVGNGGAYLSIFSGPAATNGTGGGDTWEINADGGGWHVGSTTMGVLGASNMNGTSYQFTINSDPVSKTYTVTIMNLTNSVSATSPLTNYRASAGNIENTYLNFVSTSGGSVAAGTTLGFSIDNLSVVPEPASLVLVVASCAILIVLGRRRHSRTC